MLRKTVIARALTIAFGTAVVMTAAVQPAMAQSNATGTIYGIVDTPAGATINLVNVDTGLKRSIGTEAGGRYQVTALPAGHYRVELSRGGKVAQTLEVDVVAGQGVNASFAATVQTVQVTGRRNTIDVSNTNNGAIFTGKELAKLPVAHTLNAIALLAPNTTKGDSAYGNTASFGGSGVSENAFYLNGFPITNPLSQLGSMELPFGAIQQASVLTGGFGAEYGRSIGGVMSVTTKSGTNTWEGGATYSIEPQSTHAAYKNFNYAVTGDSSNAATDGKLDLRRDNRTVSNVQYGAYLGGPIIKDKLFMFIAGDQTIGKDSYVGSSSLTNPATIAQSGWNHNRSQENRWLGKLDWNITDDHRLEFTTAGDSYQTRYQKYGYVLNPNNPKAAEQLDGVPNNQLYSSAVGKNLGPTDPEFPGTPGSTVNMLKYTGNITDDLVITGLYGVLKSKHGVSYEALGANAGTGAVPPTVLYSTTAKWPALNPALYRNYNVFPGYISRPGEDEVKSGRFDLEYKIKNHTVRAGIDASDITSSAAGQIRSGGSSWSYKYVGDKFVGQPINLSGGRPGNVADFGGSGTAGYYVSQSIFNSLTSASSKQSAQYIEDRWQVRKDLLVTLGIRNDAYSNSTGDGVKFLDMKSEVAPRASAAWDVNGDASFKVFGSAGRYYLQLPTQVAARAASRSTYTTQEFTYTGIDPTTGVPLGLKTVNTPISSDGEYGQAKNPRSVVAADLKPNYQDELTLGFEKAYSPNLNFGGKVTYRKLGAGIDDSCDTRPLLKFAADHGIDIQNQGAVNCYIFNPGRDVTVWIDGNDAAGNPVVTGKGQLAHFTAAEIGEPKAERTYAALDMFLEHPARNGWYGRVNYTLSRSKGNMEGQTRSDTGQTDVGTSAAWDFPEFAPGSNGLLPNDRKHQLKMYGYYELTPEWTVGAFALIQSGRPVLCLGTNDAADSGSDPAYPLGQQYFGPGYGAEYYNCGGKPTPRGSLGRMPWEKRLDVNLAYAPKMIQGLTVKVDVFNVFNKQAPITNNATYDDGSSGTISATYREVQNYQVPRYAKFTVEYNHKF
ncbi:Oar protein [Duganella caerulea]